MKITVIAGVALLIGAAAACADDAPKIGEWGMVASEPRTACGSLEDLDRFFEIGSSGDRMAQLSFGSQHCVYVEFYTEVLVEQNAVWHAARCVRTRGDTHCVWMKSSAIVSKAEALRVRAEREAEEAKDRAETRAIREQFNTIFDKAHPECKEWKTNKNLPEHCY